MELDSRYFLLALTVLAVGLAGSGWAADSSMPFKTYRNEKYGFEFRYPGYMNVHLEGDGRRTVVSYKDNGPLNMPLAMVRIDSVPHLSGVNCIAQEIRGANESNLKRILEAPPINGFYAGEEDEGCNRDDCSKDQTLAVSHQGACVVFRRTVFYSNQDETAKIDARLQYVKMKEILKSFRFLDGEPKDVVSFQQSPSFNCSQVNPGGVEDVICKDPVLAEKDREMAKLYQQLMSRLSEDQKVLLREKQRTWLAEREENFSKRNKNDPPGYGMEGFYASRIVRLRFWLEKSKERIFEVPKLLYRNPSHGFEFYYPSDMQLSISSASAVPMNVSLYYHPNSDNGYPNLDCSITIDKAESEEACICDWECNSRKINPTVNGFYDGGASGDASMGHGTGWENFKKYRNGQCISIHIGDRWYHWDRYGDDKSWHDGADTDDHWDMLKDLVKSFRFLDSESKTIP